MKERFTKFRKRDLIRMWRTLKAESGYRRTLAYDKPTKWDCLLRELMDAHEERIK